jgi:branched-chain amino acid transport system permease protein
MQDLLSTQLFLSALVLASVYALVSIGLNLIYGTMRLINVAHGDLMMVGGYFSFWAFHLAGIGTVWSMFGAIATTAFLGALCYLTIFRYLMSRRGLAARVEANSLLIFFGLSIIIQNLLSLMFTADARSYNYLTAIIPLGDARVELNRLAVLAIGAACTLACVLFFRFSRMGLATRALIQQRDAASLVGINADRVQLLVFCVGFGMAGLAGSLVSMTETVSPFGGFSYTIAAFIVIILGGLGNLTGGILGSIVLAIIEIYGVALTSPSFRSILIYGVFIAILFLRPQGLLGRKAI